jgi:hypothetical protein
MDGRADDMFARDQIELSVSAGHFGLLFADPAEPGRKTFSRS